MLYVFIVSSGMMMKFDMNLAVKKVQELKKEIAKEAKIPEDMQVLLCSGGEELQSDNIVGNYYGAGTDTNPIFLFSKYANEMDHYSGKSITSMDLNIEDDVKGCENMSPSASAAMVRLTLAQHFAESAMNGRRECEELVHSQHLQQQGWAAVIANLEDAKEILQKRNIHFEELFQKYLINRSSYQETIYKFPEDIELLARIPLLPKLIIENDCTAEDLNKKHTLLSWFISEPKDILETLVEKCHHLLDELNEHAIIALNEEFQRVLKTVDNSDIKEVKGIEERLSILNRKVDEAKQLEKDQLDLAAWFNQYQVQGYISNDLPALCETFQNQLEIMLNNHKCLRTILDQCTKAKMELSDSINARLKYISKVESEIYQLHMRILLLESHVQSVVSQVESYRQVQVAPLRYLKLLAEVCRRKAFSESYMKWATELSSQVSKLYHKEIDIRKSFSSIESRNMVDNLFPGMNDVPPPFAVECPPPFDRYLPDITKEDLELLKLRFPELSHFCEVVPPDPMPCISQAESDSAFSSNVPSSRVTSDYVGVLEKIPSVKEEVSSDKLAVPSTEYSSLPSEYASLPNEVFSLTSSPFEDPLLSSHIQEQHNKILQHAAKSASRDQVDSEGEEFETVDHYRMSPVAISSQSAHVTRARPTSSSDVIDVSVHQKHYPKVSKARSDGDAVSPMQEFLKSPDSLAISTDFQAAEYYIDDSMPSSYTESNATSPLLRGGRMVKSHHVVVAELQRQVEEKNGALTVTKNSLENSHSNILKLHAKISALQKFVQELQGNLRSDLSNFKSFVTEELSVQMAEVSQVVDHINSHIGKVEQEMLLEKESAVSEARAEFTVVENDYVKKLEIENQKLVDAENQIAYYEENLRSAYSSYEETKHEKELLEAELQEKKEMIQRMMLEHELEFDAFKNETREILVEKETEITQLKQNLSEAHLEAKKLLEDKSSIQEESQKQQSVVATVQEQQKLLEQELEKMQEEKRKVQDLQETEKKLELALEEKIQSVKELEKACEDLNKCKEDIEKIKATELKELEEKLNTKHKSDLESLRSRFRLAVSMTSLDKPQNFSETPDAESLTCIEDVRKIIAEDREKWESEKLKALEEEHLKTVNTLKQTVKDTHLKHEEEKTKIIAALKLKHENSLEKLKSRMTAENQVTFNEAIDNLAKEKDSVIDTLRSQISVLEAKQLAIKSYLDQLQFLPPSSTREDVMSQSESGASSSCREIQSTSEHNIPIKMKTDLEALLQITDATNLSYQPVSSSNSASTSEQASCSNIASNRKPCIYCLNKVSLLTCEPGELVLVGYDEKLEHFIILHFGNHIHFLHSESVAALDLKIPAGPSEKWTIGVVAHKEFCITKKVNNRFKLNLGTRFYRVKVNKWNRAHLLAQHRNILNPNINLSSNQSSEPPSEGGDRARTSSGMSASSI